MASNHTGKCAFCCKDGWRDPKSSAFTEYHDGKFLWSVLDAEGNRMDVHDDCLEAAKWTYDLNADDVGEWTPPKAAA